MVFYFGNGMTTEKLEKLIEEAQQKVLHDPDAPNCVFTTVVWTKKGNVYYFPIHNDVFSGDYMEQEAHIQTLVEENDRQVLVAFSIGYPSQGSKSMMPAINCWYFNYRLTEIHPGNADSYVLGWGGRTEDGDQQICILRKIRDVLPPEAGSQLRS